MIHSKSRLAIILSRLKVFEKPDLMTEQYPTDSEIAAEVLWDAYYKGDIEGKVIADFGCGTGILGIGALLLKAKMVYFIDIDLKSLDLVKHNIDTLKNEGYKLGNFVLLNKDVKEFEEKVDVVIQNPPFGTKQKHVDKDFLVKAFETTKVIYSFHKATSKDFIAKISADNMFGVTNYFEFDFPIKAAHLFHKKKLHRIKVGCWRLEKK